MCQIIQIGILHDLQPMLANPYTSSKSIMLRPVDGAYLKDYPPVIKSLSTSCLPQAQFPVISY